MVLTYRAKILIILLVTLIFRATSNMLQTSIPLYAKYVLHASAFTVSLIAMLVNIAAFFSLLFFGFRSVAIGKAIFLSLIMVCVFPLLYLVTYDEFTFTFISSIVAFWIGSLLPLLLATIAVTSGPQKRERELTIFAATLSLGLVLGPIYQGTLLSMTADNLVYSMLLFVPLVAVAAVFFSLVRLDENLKIAGNFDLGFTKRASYWVGILALESFNMPFIAVVTFGGIFARSNFGASYADIEFLFTGFFLTSFLVRLLLIRLTLSRYAVMMGSFVSTMLGLAIVYGSSTLGEVGLGFLLLGYSHGASYPIATNQIANSAPKEKLVAAFTVSSLIDNIVYSLGTPIVGIIAQYLGLNAVFIWVEMPVAAIAVAYLLLSKYISVKTLARPVNIGKSLR